MEISKRWEWALVLCFVFGFIWILFCSFTNCPTSLLLFLAWTNGALGMMIFFYFLIMKKTMLFLSIIKREAERNGDINWFFALNR
jgi:hypothetical protein